MFGFRNDSDLPHEQLSHDLGSNQLSEAQWVVEGVLGTEVAHAIAELHVPRLHVPLGHAALATQVAHLADLAHIRH